MHTTFTRRAVTALGRPLFGALFEIVVAGRQALPARGRVVLAANHVSNFDVFPMQIAALPRPIYYMAKSELFANPALGWLMRQLGAFPVRRGTGDTWSLEHARKVLEADQVLGIFPEGGRSRGQGLRAGKSGAANLAIKTGAPIVPMAITGTDRLFRPWYRRSPVTITFAPALWPEPGENADALTQRLMLAIARLLPPAHRGVYG